MTSDRDTPAQPSGGRAPAVEPHAAGPEEAGATPRVVTSESLLGGARQLAILHDRTLYFLRQTRYGKLILTK